MPPVSANFAEMQYMHNYSQHPYHYIQPRSGNDGNSSDSEDEENEALFKKEADESKVAKLPEEVKETLAGKRAEPEKSEEEKILIAKSEEVILDDDDSEESDDEPQDCDLVLGFYDDVQRTKNKSGRRYKIKLSKVIFKVAHKDYVAGKLTADIEY